MAERFEQFVSVLRLARIALVFTAISNVWLVVFLGRQQEYVGRMDLLVQLILTALTATGLYVFGMVMNDVLDQRRDKVFAPNRPLPAGKLHPTTAILIAIVALLIALGASTFVEPYSAITCVLCAGLIFFYDAAGKYLTIIGLVSLGVIRALNMMVGFPMLIFCWPVFLTVTHVILISLIAYRLEGKRPKLGTKDVMAVLAGWVFCGLVMVGWIATRWQGNWDLPHTIWIGPLVAVVAFVIYVSWRMKQARRPREAGGILVKVGLIWLIVYDAAWLFSAGLWKQGLVISALLPLTILVMATMRQLNQASSASSEFSYKEEVRDPVAQLNQKSVQED